MAKNFIQPGLVLSIPAPANVASGGVILAGNFVGIAQGDAAAGETVDMALTGVWELPKVAANSFALGDIVYWDAANSLATSTETTATLGLAAEAAPAGGATVIVRLASL